MHVKPYEHYIYGERLRCHAFKDESEFLAGIVRMGQWTATRGFVSDIQAVWSPVR